MMITSDLDDLKYILAALLLPLVGIIWLFIYLFQRFVTDNTLATFGWFILIIATSFIILGKFGLIEQIGEQLEGFINS